ncbi:MAG: hypothetical protein OK422_00055 [Thaumarchaeota archaeon]|nr:hypothetical protein [Nitrososphaerota archaeon]
MAPPIVSLLTWVHILGVAGWIGGVFYEAPVHFPLLGAIPVEVEQGSFPQMKQLVLGGALILALLLLTFTLMVTAALL